MQTLNTQILRNVITAGILIIAGSIVYLFFRPNIILFNKLGMTNFLSGIQIEVNVSQNFFVHFLMYCLSDVLWYSALLILASTFYVKEVLVSKILFATMVLMPFVLELLQLARLLPGTFDWYDIVFYCITLIIFVLLWIRKPNCLLLHR
ncbi:MAG: hypothetical protein IJK62_14855 [Bacteroidales bacterium]|nr:hypothetical protein [Bacteroidales bacterium]